MKTSHTLLFLLLSLLASCSLFNKSNKQDSVELQVVELQFDADSAYAFCQAQCDFGPRTMNSEAHNRCGEWIKQKFAQYGCLVESQRAELTAYDNTKLQSENIIARLNPDAQTRILFCAHWDSRPWADNDPDEANHHTPVLAANDGASGVAVMLEMARVLSTDSVCQLGIDFVCFDAEDWGTPQWSDQPDDPDSWALGAQHWAANLPADANYLYGVLLDMVGGKDATFSQEQISLHYAPTIVRRVWDAAHRAGFGSYFPRSQGGAITDDHVPVNTVAGIPCIDVIPYHPDCQASSFGPTWHTIDDTMQNISPATLKAVGQTMLQLLLE